MHKSAIIFDLDGTLTKPFLNFDAIRAEIGIKSGPILEAIEMMGTHDRQRAEAIILRHENIAATHAELHDGAAEVVAECRRRGYPVAILTRNTRPTAVRVLSRFGIEVDWLRTREDGAIKPSAEPVLAICRELGANPRESWMVGDYLFDIQAGRAAGTRTVLMLGKRALPTYSDQADHVIRSLSELPLLLNGR